MAMAAINENEILMSDNVADEILIKYEVMILTKILKPLNMK